MKYVDKIFGMFQRLHDNQDLEGNGFGLAMVQRITKKHKSTLWAQAELQKGATFYFTMGRQQAAELSGNRCSGACG